MERKDVMGKNVAIYKSQAAALEKNASKDCKVGAGGAGASLSLPARIEGCCCCCWWLWGLLAEVMRWLSGWHGSGSLRNNVDGWWLGGDWCPIDLLYYNVLGDLPAVAKVAVAKW